MQSRIGGLFLLAFLAVGCGKNLEQQLRDSVRNLDNAELKKEDVEILDVQRNGDLAIAEVKIQTALKLRLVGDSWHLEEIRLGDRRWEQADRVLSALKLGRQQGAQQDLEEVAAALERFRSSRGGLPEAETFEQLIDRLSPTFLARVIRLDPWSRAYSYQRLAAGAYDLRSAGPDGNFHTSDDVIAGGGSE